MITESEDPSGAEIHEADLAADDQSIISAGLSIAGVGEGSSSRGIACLVDTGAAVNMFDVRVLEEVGAKLIEGQELTLVALSGAVTAERYNVRLKPGLKDFQYLESYGVENWPYEDFEGILGRPFLDFCHVARRIGGHFVVKIDPDDWSVGISSSARRELRETSERLGG